MKFLELRMNFFKRVNIFVCLFVLNFVLCIEGETCNKLTPINVDLTCYRNDTVIDCNEPLITGDRVFPTCKQLHTYNDSAPTYKELVCQEDGKWNNTLFSCVADCGYTASFVSSPSNHFSDSPWHVAIYDMNNNKSLICGGTIISPNLILSAAHCFYDSLNQRKMPEANFEIVVGKYSRDYAIKDNIFQTAFKVKEIRFSDKGYFASQTHFANDIAIVILDRQIDINLAAFPACVDWTHTEKFSPAEGAKGKVVGWGETETGELSEKLMTADLPFISSTKCLQIAPDDYKSYITYDKFCAGNQQKNGPQVARGDGGGGLLFREFRTGYNIRGIVSLKHPKGVGISMFTDLADHMNWISNVRREVDGY